MKTTYRSWRFTADHGIEREFYRDDAGEWWVADMSCVIDIETGYRIGRWLGPKRWDFLDARRYLGLDPLSVTMVAS